MEQRKEARVGGECAAGDGRQGEEEEGRGCIIEVGDQTSDGGVHRIGREAVDGELEWISEKGVTNVM